MHKETTVEVTAICAKSNTNIARVQMIVDGIPLSIIAKYKQIKHKGEVFYKVFCKIKNKNRRILARAMFVRFSITIGTLL